MSRALFLLLASSLFVKSFGATTTVTQNIVGPDRKPATGQAIIDISTPCQSGSDYVGDRHIIVKFVNGAFTVNLVPNDTCTPALTTYNVQWVLNGGTEWTETWAVPTTSSPVSVNSVIVPATPDNSPAWTRGTFSIAVTQPLASDTGLIQYTDAFSYGIGVVSCSTDTGTATINLDVRAAVTPNTPGANVLSTPLVCSPSSTASAVLSPTVPVTANAPVALQVLSVSGAPNVVRVFVSKSSQ